MDGFLLQPKGGIAAEWVPRVIPYFSRGRLWEGLYKELVGILGKPSPCQFWTEGQASLARAAHQVWLCSRCSGEQVLE